MDVKNVVVVGASAGGMGAVSQLIESLPADLSIAMFIVIHMSKHSQAAIIVKRLQKLTTYKCRVAQNDEITAEGHIYLAPTDQHLFLKPGKANLIYGAHENRWRPSIDVLFRSAAVAYSARVIGVILSGLLDDGTSGMSAIKRSGGICIVQEPADAEFDEMPLNVIRNVEVDHRVPTRDMGYIIADLLSRPIINVPVPEDIMLEAAISERMISSIEEVEKLGVRSNYVCPDCGGGLWEVGEYSHKRYRCYTGHVYTAATLIEKQAEKMEGSLWVSIRMLEENRNMLLTMKGNSAGSADLAAHYQQRSDELGVHAERLKELMLSVKKTERQDEGYL